MSALDTQVGGDHYKKLKIQPMEYSMANGLDSCQHTVVKYVTRFRDKGGINDLMKAKHTIDMLIELEMKRVAEQDRAEQECGRPIFSVSDGYMTHLMIDSLLNKKGDYE